jgi:glutamyl-tRNA reductase
VSERELFLVGLSHHSAPIEVRERVALSGDALKEAIRELVDGGGAAEALVVSTCNRVEVLVHAETDVAARAFFTGRALDAAAHLYAKRGPDAVRHFFRVAASLDSMVVGEQQILGQVKEAYGLACGAGTAGPFLSRLCNHAFAAAKRVRTDTEVGRGMTSLSQVAVGLVEKIFGDLAGRTILLAGAGKMGALSAKALAGLRADRLLVANRSPERGLALAAQVNGVFRAWEELPRLLVEADVIIVSTGADRYVVTKEMVHAAMRVRRDRSMCLIDLSVPRNVDPACADLSDVFAYDVDDLEKVVASTREARQEEAARAERLVEADALAFTQDRRARAALPVLGKLRQHAEQIARVEAERTLAHLGGLDDRARRSVEAMAQAIVNKLLHAPTARLRKAAAAGDSELPAAAAQLFGIEPDAPGAPGTAAASQRSPDDGDAAPVPERPAAAEPGAASDRPESAGGTPDSARLSS